LTSKRSSSTRLARSTAKALRALTRGVGTCESDLADFETIIPRESIRTAAQNELKELYDSLGGVTISIDDI
jgi:hypothetical protein